MIYRDYLKAKNQNSIKFKEVEGTSPLSIFHSKGRDLKNYQIYGNSTQKTTGKNMLPYPFADTTRTIYGITFTDNKDGTITLNGTSTFSTTTSIADFYLCRNISISAGTYTLSGCPSGGSTYKYRLMMSIKKSGGTTAYSSDIGQGYSFTVDTDTTVTLTIRIGGEIGTVSNLAFKPQLELGSTATDYEAYHMSPSPEFPSEIESVGDLTTKNLLYPYSNAISRTLKGVTMTYDNGVITLNGTCTASANFDLYNIALSANTYTLSANANKVPVNNGYAFVQLYDSTNNQIITLVNSNAMGSVTTTTISDGTFLYRIRIDEGTTYDNVVLKPQLEIGSTATAYEPYHKYDVPVTVHGKNLFDKSKSNSVNIREESATSYWGSLIFENKNVISMLKPNATYTISYDIECIKTPAGDNITINSAAAGIAFYSGISGYSQYFTYKSIQLEAGNTYHIEQTFTTDNKLYDSNANYKFIAAGNRYYDENNKAYYCTVIIRNIQVEEGTTATSYEPYKGKTTKHIYLDEPLRKVGDYADYIDFKNQKVVRNIVEDSLYANAFYKKLSSVARFGRTKTNIKQKLDTHMLSTILNYDFSWYKDVESIFHHNGAYYNYYWSVYWSRLGLTYDGTNVYRTDDTEQTPLTNSEVLNIANEWLKTLSDEDKKVFMILDTPTEESISLPILKTVKGTSIMSVDTSIQPSNMKIKYIRM